MSTTPSTYINYVDGASLSTRKISSTTWVIFSPTYELVGYGGIFLGPPTNNVMEYSAVIEIISKSTSLGINCLVVRLYSQLMVSQLNLHYSVCNPTLFRKYLRVHLFEQAFKVISYE